MEMNSSRCHYKLKLKFRFCCSLSMILKNFLLHMVCSCVPLTKLGTPIFAWRCTNFVMSMHSLKHVEFPLQSVLHNPYSA